MNVSVDLMVPPTALDVLMPLHLLVSKTGHILHAGPTMCKLWLDTPLIGTRFLEVFEVKRPRQITKFADMPDAATFGLRVALRSVDRFALKGHLVRLPDGNALVNLSLGISVVDAVCRHDLISADFAPSDMTVDMLYLIEAKTAALEESKRLNERLQGAKYKAEQQAFTDMLTGLKNRRAMDAFLVRMTHDETPFGLMHLDLDYFKQVNDTLGHAAGDHVLQRVARVLTSQTRSGDLVARVGGDEFVLAFHDCVDLGVLNKIAARIIEDLEKPIMFEGKTCRISASIGTTLSSYYTAPTPDQMLNDADQALYVSKEQGRACHTVFMPDQCL